MAQRLARIASKIRLLNKLGYPVIFAVTGGNGTGKTTLTKNLYTYLPFFNIINLGIIVKLMKLFHGVSSFDTLENATNSKLDLTISKALLFLVHNYQTTGVNVIIDGVQVDTNLLSKQDAILGGVVLTLKEPNILIRNRFPQTHFFRKLEAPVKVNYGITNKFKVVSNDSLLEEALAQTLSFLDQLLDKKIKGLNARRINKTC